MFKSFEELKGFCTANEIRVIDFKVIDMSGRWHHLTIPVERLTEKTVEKGIGMDGSSYGFLSVEKSDMVFRPDLSTAFVDPFAQVPMISIISDIYSLGEKTERFAGDPRYVAEKAERYLKDTGVADECLLGPELEFYILDHVSYRNDPHHTEVVLDSVQAHWNSGNREYQNQGYTVRPHGGYHVDIPADSSFDLRNEIVLALEKHGVPIKYHHSENGGPGQVEIELSFGGLQQMADRTQLVKYFIKNLALQDGRTATFMPKPFFGEAGSGMHAHIQWFNQGKPVFYGDNYAGLSDTALFAIGGILKHSAALLAFTNPSTNSFKRLVPGYEAPVSIGFASANRSSVIRIPGYADAPESKRFEFRPMDATCNPYLAYSALIMAALDGINNKIDPTKEGFGPFDFNLYTLSEEEQKKIKSLPKSLDEAADALERDHQFLLAGGVFTSGLIQDQLRRIRSDAQEVNNVPHPLEFAKYYDL
ncbi:MAG: type I glutamate--ammonia ligase [Firmicutes bacterium]|nr:type I glutamate--ammonia ligase [Bacillota bacterium]